MSFARKWAQMEIITILVEKKDQTQKDKYIKYIFSHLWALGFL